MIDRAKRILYNTEHQSIIANNCQRRKRHVKTTGIVRRVDELGRVVLPIELRRTLDIGERDELEICLDEDRIILKKLESACIFCGANRTLVQYCDKHICKECISKMDKL